MLIDFSRHLVASLMMCSINIYLVFTKIDYVVQALNMYCVNAVRIVHLFMAVDFFRGGSGWGSECQLFSNADFDRNLAFLNLENSTLSKYARINVNYQEYYILILTLIKV
jgi:hypothetical protein